MKRTFLLVAAVLFLITPGAVSAGSMIEAGRSFLTFEQERPYSINFVWGPQIGFTEQERHTLYSALPPSYLSGTLVVNTLLLGIVLVIVVEGLLRKTPRKIALRRAGTVLLAGWILMDARMGSEFLSWVATDHVSYISAAPEERTFRDRKRFYDFAEFSKQFVDDRESYVFFARQPWPYLGNMRYLTYPSIPGIDYKKDDTWVIYDRPDMAVDADGRIAVGGQALTKPGTIIGRFDASSFVFRTE